MRVPKKLAFLTGAALLAFLPPHQRENNSAFLSESTPSAPPATSAPSVSSSTSTAFLNYLQSFLGTPPAERADLLETGIRLAQRRKPTVLALIRSDPETALRQAIPRRIWRQLPPAIRAHVEQPIDASGDFLVHFSCDFDSRPIEDPQHPDPVSRQVRLGDKLYKAHVFGRRLQQPSQTGIPIHGIALDGELALSDDPYRLLDPSETENLERPPGHLAASFGGEIRLFASSGELQHAAHAQQLAENQIGDGDNAISPSAISYAPPVSPSWSTGHKRILYARFDFPDLPGNRIDVDEATTQMQIASDHLNMLSFGKLTVETDVVEDVIRLPRESSYYAQIDDYYLRLDARAAIREAGVHNPDDYDLDILAFYYPGLRYAGAGYVGFPGVFLNSTLSDAWFPAVIVHELGHNFGLGHAHALRTSTSDPLDENAPVQLYGDPVDTMGAPSVLQPLNAWFKARLHWLEEDEWLDVTTDNETVLYRQDINQPGGRIRGIRASSASNDSRLYWIDMQQDSHSKGGVAIRYESLIHSVLIDAKPETYTFADYPLLSPATLVDSKQKMEIEIADLGGNSPEDHFARIAIRYLGPPTLVEQATGGIYTEGQTLNLTVAAAGTPPLRYQWYKDGVPIPGAQQPQISALPARPEDTGNYSVTIANDYGQITQENIPVLVFTETPSAGKPDPELSGRVVGTINTLVPDESDGIFVGGNLYLYQGEAVWNLFRIRADGTIDDTFAPPQDFDAVRAIALQDNGNILVGFRKSLARLSETGQLDPTFQYATDRTDGDIDHVAVLPNGSIIVAGTFSTFDGIHTGPMVRLWPDGSFAESLGRCTEENPEQSCIVERLFLEPDGKFVVQTRIATDYRPTRYLDRYHPDGTLDTDFQYTPETPFGPSAIAPALSDGEVTGFWLFDTDQKLVQKLRVDGSRDLDYRTLAIRGYVRNAATAPTGEIFLNINFIDDGRKGIYRMKEGEFDSNFHFENLSGQVTDLAAEPDGNALVSGEFQTGPNPLRLLGKSPALNYELWALENQLVDPNADPGNHGIPNLLRYAFALDPIHPERDFLPSISYSQNADDSATLVLTFRRRQCEDLRYIVETSQNLTDWQPLSPAEISESASPISDGLDLVTIQHPLPLTETTSLFLRLRIVKE